MYSYFINREMGLQTKKKGSTMKKLVLLICMLFVTTYAHAGIDNSIDNSSKSIAKGGKAIQGQLQGQVGINKAVGTGNETHVGGDDIEVLSLTIPSTPSTQGKVESSIGSPWGYINKNTPTGAERIQWYAEFTKELYAKGHLEADEYLEEIELMKKLAKRYVKGSKISKVPVLGLLAQ
jgi:hypothetical protein